MLEGVLLCELSAEYEQRLEAKAREAGKEPAELAAELIRIQLDRWEKEQASACSD